MISKFLHLILLISLVFLSSCSEFLKGKPEKKETLEIKQEAMSCLQDVSLQISKFMKSESEASEMDKTFNCFDQTLSEFQNKVEGREKADQFNQDELFEIFDKFIKNAELTRDAIGELLLLKSAFLGGSEQFITKTEINDLRQLIKSIKTEALFVLPYAKVFNLGNTNTKFSKAEIQGAFAQMSTSLKKLLRQTQLVKSAYSINNLVELIKALNIIESDQNPYINLIHTMNSLIVGVGEVSSMTDREMYIDSMSAAMQLYLLQKHSYAQFSNTSPVKIAESVEYIQMVISFLENTLQFKKTNLISAETLDPLITSIHEANAFPLKVNLDTILTFYKTIMVKVFQSGLRSDIEGFNGIQKVHLTHIKKELSIYKIYTEYLASSFYKTDKNQLLLRYSEKAVRDNLKNHAFAEAVNKLTSFDSTIKNQILIALNEYRAQDFAKHNLLYRSKRLVIGWNQNIWDQNWHDLMTSLQIKMMARLMILGWGELSPLKEVSKSFMTEQGTVQWYSEFRKIGIELKSFDPRAENLGLKTLTGANLFTKSGDGNNKMSFSETIEQIAILVTAGSVLPEVILSHLEKAHCQLAEQDVFGNNWHNEACFVDDFKKNFANYFLNLPYTVRYLKSLNENQVEEYYYLLMDVARVDAQNKGVRVETADIKALATMLHYIESLYVIYDSNHNMKLEVDEIRRGYAPRFVKFATDFAYKTSKAQIEKFKSTIGYGCYSEQDLIKESFVFLLINQVTPKQSDLNLFPCNPIYKRELIEQKGSVDRKTIINTFKILKAVLGS